MRRLRHSQETANPGRRTLLAFTAAGLAVPVGAMAPLGWRGERAPSPGLSPICRAAADTTIVAPGSAPREVKLCWNINAVCHSGIAAADALGIFTRHNLKIERINFSGASDQLLELIASGKADGGVGMALGWLKPLEQGFDVKLIAALHGGCIRLLTNEKSGITSVAGLKGKTVGTVNMASPDRNFVSVLATKNGIDPLRDIEWRVYPADLLTVALQKGEIQAFSSNDPIASVVRDRDHLIEVTNNLAGDYANRCCCVLGIRAGLVRDDRAVAAALTVAILEAQEWVAENPDRGAEIFAANNKGAGPEQIAAMLRSHTHHHHPVNSDLKQEIALYAQELKQAQVFRQSTDPVQFADRVCVDILAT